MGWATTAVNASGTWIAVAVLAVDPADELSAPQAEPTKPVTTTAPATSQRPERLRTRVARGARLLF
jgi:hypothetical protein